MPRNPGFSPGQLLQMLFSFIYPGFKEHAASLSPLDWFELNFLNYSKKISVWIRVFLAASHRKPTRAASNNKENFSKKKKNSPKVDKPQVQFDQDSNVTASLWAMLSSVFWLCCLVGFPLEGEKKNDYPVQDLTLANHKIQKKRQLLFLQLWRNEKSWGLLWLHCPKTLYSYLKQSLWSGNDLLCYCPSLTIPCGGGIILTNLGLRNIP